MDPGTTTSEEINFSYAYFGAYVAGFLATACFTIQYAPQAYLNYQRKSVQGFSTTGIIVKLLGAAFLMANAFLRGEPAPVVLYGLFNIIQHSIFIVQFYIYEKNPKFLQFLLLPLAAVLFALTNFVKPACQVISHIPQLYVTWIESSVVGVSLSTQHLNVAGGLLGLYMCMVMSFKDWTTPVLYLNSMFQAISLYVLAFLFDGWSFSLRKNTRQSPSMDKSKSEKAADIESGRVVVDSDDDDDDDDDQKVEEDQQKQMENETSLHARRHEISAD